MASDQNMTTYGIPLYGASWVPLNAVRSTVSGADTSATTTAESSEYLVLAGGGGEGNNGIPNLILLTQFNFSDNSLASKPVVRLETGEEVPYRIAVHPRGEGVICSFPRSCRWFDWDMTDNNGQLGLRSSDRVLTKLEHIGQQVAITFSEDGSLLAIGGEDGKLRVLKWPSLEVLLSEEQAYSAVKDLHFSIDGKYLVSIGIGGPCKVWDVTKSEAITSLPKQKDEIFGFCRFVQSSERDQILYTVDKGGSVISWNTQSWKRISSKRIVQDTITAFNVSVDGKFLAIGTGEGHVVLLDSLKLQVQRKVKNAHLVVVTALAFSHDLRALASVSMDSRVRITLVPDEIANGFNYRIIIMFIVLALAIYLYFLKASVREY